MKLKYIFFLIAFAATAQVYARQDTLRVEAEEPILDLAHHVEYHIDLNSKMSFQDVIQPQNTKLFHREMAEVANFSNSSEAVWFRFAFENKLDKDVYLQIGNLYIEHIDIYVVDSLGVTVTKAGLALRGQTKNNPLARYIIPLGGPGGGTRVVYGNLRSKGKHFWVPLQVGTFAALTASGRTIELVSIGVLGILLVMFFYNVCLMIVIKLRIYAVYVFYVLTAVIYHGYYSGYFFDWFPTLLTYPIGNLPVAFLYIALQLFSNELLAVGKEWPWMYRISYLMYFIAGLLLLTPILPEQLPQVLMDFMNLAFPTYLLTAAALSFNRKRVLTTIFLVGWLPIIIVAILFALMRNGFFFNQFFQVNAVGMAMTWEVTLFSLLLGYRYNEMRQEKLRVQAENLKLVSEHNLLLEQEVKARTEEVTRKNQELLLHQEEILTQRDMLENQNRELHNSRQIIDQHNQMLESAVQKRTLELAQANQELQNGFHQLEQFSFITAHNLRGPVARILGLASIFDLNGASNQENKNILAKILESAKDIDTVLHDLGNILNVQKSKSELVEPILFNDLVEKIKRRFSKEIKDYSIDVMVRSDVVHLYSIPAYVDSIVTNLISNAIKYRSAEVTPQITISLEESEGIYHLLVTDNGMGFDSEKYADKIFEPFQRFNTHTEGKGLGMFLVKTQVTALKGVVDVKSKIGQGTRIDIKFPHPGDSFSYQ